MSGPELVFGKYEIQHRLAIGGMGEVFYAVQKGIPGFERPVILKSLLPDLAAQEGFIEQFLDEARVAATLNHPNVVSIYEVGLWNGTYFIAMEYIRGRNLAQLLRRAIEQELTLPVAVVARIVADAALGLDHAHNATANDGQPLHVIHRDISPQNIMVRDDGVTKVVDFGIARASNRSTRTATGTLKGKLAYMPPEQVLGKGPISPALDQYALGVCFWEMLTLRRLFKAESDLQLVKLVLETSIPSPSTVRADLDPVLDAIVMRMVQRDPARRFESCAQVALAISDFLATKSQSGIELPATFMRRLGTDDLNVRVKTAGTSKNFVISLQPERDDLHIVTATGRLPPTPSNPRLIAPPRSSKVPLMVLGAVVLAVLGMGTYLALRPADPSPLAVEVIDAGAPIAVAQVVDAGPPVVAEVEPVDAGPPVAEVAPAVAKVVISTQPERAAVRLDGRPLGISPVEVEIAPGVVHYLQVEKVGYRRAEQEVSAAPGEKVEVKVKLVANSAPPPVVVKEVPAQASEPGVLTLNTTPFTKVQIDGDPAGSTPLKVRLAAGKHTLVLVNEGEELRVTRTIELKSGENLKLSLPLKP